MCGIIGFVSSRNLSENRDWLAKGSNTIIHRGPDGYGEWYSTDGKVGMGHRRLSIIDLTESASQPMRDINNGNVIIYNGELYNYLELKKELIKNGYNFNTKSDTEVLMYAYDMWGLECVSRFNGMFAFAIYDYRKQIVFIARDRAGEKPLFYSLENNILKFGSELKAFMYSKNIDHYIDNDALDCYLTMGYVPGDMCILNGFNKLNPASALLFNIETGVLKKWKYWELPKLLIGNNDIVQEDDIVNELENLLESSVKLQMIADVPVGVLLSGGVDSSLITAMACRNSNNVKTFTICFPGHENNDESKYAKLISDHFGTEHLTLDAQPPTSDLVFKLAKQFDEPMVDSSMIPTFMVSQLIKNHCTVALGGDGGDELFGGYTSHRSFLNIANKYQHIPYDLRKYISLIAKNSLPIGMRGRNYLMNIGLNFKSDVPIFSELFDSTSRKKILPYSKSFIGEQIRKDLSVKDLDIIQRLTRTDFCNYLPEDILVKVDRASMMNSLEIRAPFLDYRLIDFAFSKVPSNLKTSLTDQKIILKKLSKKILPNQFDYNRKQGFSIPINTWLKSGQFRDLFWDVLSDSNCIFEKTEVRKLLNGQDKGYSNGERIFSLVLFELWRKEYSIKY